MISSNNHVGELCARKRLLSRACCFGGQRLGQQLRARLQRRFEHVVALSTRRVQWMQRVLGGLCARGMRAATAARSPAARLARARFRRAPSRWEGRAYTCRASRLLAARASSSRAQRATRSSRPLSHSRVPPLVYFRRQAARAMGSAKLKNLGGSKSIVIIK